MGQPWSLEVQERCAQIYHDENHDVFIFRFYHDNSYAALPRQTPLGMQIILNAAEIVYYCSQRMKHLTGADV